VFDDASYASSRVIAAEIHSPPRSISSQMPTTSAQPLAQSTQIPQAYQFSPAAVPLVQSSLSVQPPTPSHGSEVTLLREQLQRTTAHLVWLSSNVAKLSRFDTSLSLGLYVTEAHMAMTLPRRADDMAFRYSRLYQHSPELLLDSEPLCGFLYLHNFDIISGHGLTS